MSSLDEKSLQKFSQNIVIAANSLEQASKHLRACYTKIRCVNEVLSMKKYEELRSEVSNSAKVYDEKIMPFSTAVVTQIQEFCEKYKNFDFEMFKKFLKPL